MPPKVGVRWVKEEQHYRTGWLLEEAMTQKMLDQAMEMKKLIHKSSVEQKRFMDKKTLLDTLDTVRGLMMMAYPAFHGLGDWEPIVVILENGEEADQAFQSQLADNLEPESTTLWAVNKELQRGKTIADHFGKNEKTKVVVKATSKGGGAPQREPMIDEDTHKKMLAYYHRKTEESKKLEEADEGDQYLNSAWADNKKLKAELHGTGAINWKMGGMGGLGRR